LLEEFPDKDWSCSALDWLVRQIDATGSADRKSGSSRECMVCTRDIQVSVQMATISSTNCNWWYCVRTAKATFHIGNFCFWVPFFKQLLLKNCAGNFVEICNVCTRKVIIKAAKRIFNSDKICRNYCDFYFGVTFLEHTVCSTYTEYKTLKRKFIKIRLQLHLWTKKLNVGMCHFLHQHCCYTELNVHYRVSILSNSDQALIEPQWMNYIFHSSATGSQCVLRYRLQNAFCIYFMTLSYMHC